MSILITGGAGYVGSHTARLFNSIGLNTVVLDNLSTGKHDNLRWGSFVEGDVSNGALIRHVIRKHRVTAVLHLAASAQVGESIVRPDIYFANNTSASLRLLDAMMAEGVKRFIFASSCSVYGNISSYVAHEEDLVVPVSPYGESKLQTERALSWYELAYGLRWVALRYFNVAGAADGLGEDISTSPRIIPRAIYSAVQNGPPLRIFGAAFTTSDGSAVRDYVHVADVAQANLQALRFLDQDPPGVVINIGSGVGTSVLQIIKVVSEQTKKEVPYQILPARPGDPSSAVSNSDRAKRLLGWAATGSHLTEIVASLLETSGANPRKSALG
jgi:UDP-arabinose 4-epimerase